MDCGFIHNVRHAAAGHRSPVRRDRQDRRDGRGEGLVRLLRHRSRRRAASTLVRYSALMPMARTTSPNWAYSARTRAAKHSQWPANEPGRNRRTLDFGFQCPATCLDANILRGRGRPQKAQ